jgi:hypothetical protein
MTQAQSITLPFLKKFYGDAVSKDGRFALWTKHNKRHLWCSSIEDATSRIEEHRDTYFTMALFPRGVTKRTKDNARALFGVWLDIDCGDKDNGKNYFPGPADALDWVLDTLVGKWSIIVHSGGGLHVYLLFDEPFWIENEEDRTRIQRVMKGWWTMINGLCPYDIDPIHDISRIMRLPGTFNSGAKALCHVIDENDTVIAFSDLEEMVPKVELTNDISHTAALDGEVDHDSLKMKINLLIDQDKVFESTWQRRRRFADKSPSAFCMAIANYLAMSQFSDSEIVAALKLWRTGQPDAGEKPDEWYLGTLAKARQVNKLDTVGNQIAAVLEDEDKEDKLKAISAVFQRVVKTIEHRVVPEYKGKKEKSSYVVIFEDGGTLIVPNTETLLSQSKMKVLAFEEAGIMMHYLKPDKWNDFLTLILQNLVKVKQELEGNLAFNIEQELRRFIEKKRESCNVVKDLGVLRPSQIYEEEGRVYFMWPTFKMHLASAGYNINNKELAGVLKGLGCSTHQFSNVERTRMWCATPERHDDGEATDDQA